MIIIGKSAHGNVKIDLEKLIETRLLINANSGGGKSWAIRKLLEETHGKVQHIILDLEGEFHTLREKFDYLLIGKGGDIPIDLRSVELLAKKLLELKVSAIIDLYELKQHERIRFVRLFLDAMVNAPKELWHPVLVILDEAHVLAPEKGESEATGSVIDIATRGRKRGFGAGMATQRLSKLSKDAAAEMNNVMIGRTTLDIDMKRAADVLGFSSRAEMLTLRELEPGEFYVYGPAFSVRTIEKVKIGAIQTSHPKVGKRAAEIPKITPAITDILSKLADLPQKAEEELKEKQDFVRKIRELESELRRERQAQPGVVDPKRLEHAKEKGYGLGFEAGQKDSRELVKKLRAARDASFVALLEAVRGQKVQLEEVEKSLLAENKSLLVMPAIPKLPVRTFVPRVIPQIRRMQPVQAHGFEDESQGKEIGRCERAILKFLALREGKAFTKVQVGAMTNYSAKSGGFNNSLSRLRQIGLINGSDTLRINKERLDEIIGILGDEYSAPENEAIEAWLGKLGVCAKKIYAVLLEDKDRIFSKEEIAESTGYSAVSGGFNNAISNICTLGLAVRENGGLRFNPELREV